MIEFEEFPSRVKFQVCSLIWDFVFFFFEIAEIYGRLRTEILGICIGLVVAC